MMSIEKTIFGIFTHFLQLNICKLLIHSQGLFFK